jgi:hypothetical protein
MTERISGIRPRLDPMRSYARFNSPVASSDGAILIHGPFDIRLSLREGYFVTARLVTQRPL